MHFGLSLTTVDAYVTLDHYCASQGIDDVYVIKIDTDGYEYEVLKGAAEVIAKQRPYVIFELAMYVLEEKGITFEALVHPLVSCGYVMHDLQTGKEITFENVSGMVPAGGSIDVIATPI